MGYRLSKIYTKTGDNGTTSLDGQERILKSALRLEIIGTIDELNSVLGFALSQGISAQSIKKCLTDAQQQLFNLGGELCPPHHPAIETDAIVALEQCIDSWNESLPPLKEFILPGGNPAAAACHIARTVCRRAERVAVALNQTEPLRPQVLQYLNRLSDALFVAARALNQASHEPEISWDHERKS